MSITDILILLGIIAFVLLGIRDGFFKKVFGILGFLGGLIAATKFMNPVAELFIGWANFSEEMALVFAFFIIFIFVVIIINLFYKWFGKTSDENLKAWSRITGGVLGAGQGIVAVSLILLMLNIFEIPTEESKDESVFYDQIIQVAPEVFNYTTKWMPSSKKFFDELKSKFENIKLPH